jgi:hypothetical protein
VLSSSSSEDEDRGGGVGLDDEDEDLMVVAEDDQSSNEEDLLMEEEDMASISIGAENPLRTAKGIAPPATVSIDSNAIDNKAKVGAKLKFTIAN